MATILVIDDNDALRQLIKAVLRRRSHEVVEARDGTEGSDALKACAFDMVITDIVMPGKTGLDLIREFHADGGQAKILAISGGGDGGVDHLATARSLGAHGTLGKPFTTGELVEAVQRLLAN